MDNSQLLEINNTRNGQAGLSLVEILIALVVTSIMLGIAIMSLSAPKKFAADDQVLKILDVLQEARQRTINQKTVMRVEFNNATNQVRLIDENDTKTSAAARNPAVILNKDSDDDVVIKSVTFNTTDVTVGLHPANVSPTNVPTQSSPVPELVFTQSQYPSSLSQNVFTLCFLKDGTVVQTSADGSCAPTNSLRGATIYVFSRPVTSTSNAQIVRAVTVSGITGAGNIYKCKQDSSGNCTQWIN